MQMLFPSGLAQGEAFCNRERERELLHHNVLGIRHTLIISPRRYGKTSLALQALKESKQAYAHINFFNALKDEFVAQKFIHGCAVLLNSVLPGSQKALKKLAALFKHIQISLEIKEVGITFSLKSPFTDPLQTIRALLEDLERVLEAEAKTGVLFLDEFQDILKTEMNDHLQAELRDFAQQTRHVVFIISGSHRHMLSKIFDERNKPFYKLCDRINLERIKTPAYEAFLQHYAKLKWNKALDQVALTAILSLTENHPYYVNRLCAKLWSRPQLPDIEEVSAAWHSLSEEEYDSVANDISLLSKNQRLLLQAIAQKELLIEPNALAFTQNLNMAPSSITQALQVLVREDFVEYSGNAYRVLDPLIKYILSKVC